MKRADVDVFEKLTGQLDSLHQEMSVLARKSPNDAVNAFKLRFLNAALKRCNEFFGEKYRPFSDLDLFPEDQLPSNSDVTFIISQYIECAEKFRADNIEHSIGKVWYWKTEDSGEKVRTAPPRKIEPKK